MFSATIIYQQHRDPFVTLKLYISIAHALRRTNFKVEGTCVFQCLDTMSSNDPS